MSKNLEDEFIETTFGFNDCDEDNALVFPKAQPTHNEQAGKKIDAMFANGHILVEKNF